MQSAFYRHFHDETCVVRWTLFPLRKAIQTAYVQIEKGSDLENNFSAQGEGRNATIPGSYTQRTLDNWVQLALLDPVKQKKVQGPFENFDYMTPNQHNTAEIAWSPVWPRGNGSTALTKVRKEPSRFTTIALTRTGHDHESTTWKALKGNGPKGCRKAIGKEITALEKKCWEMIERPKDEHISHTKFVLEWRCGEKGTIERYNARMVPRGNNNWEVQENSFSPMADYTAP